MRSFWRIGYCLHPAPEAASLLQTAGYGATLGGGRWHTKSPHHLIYAASSRALCQLEKRVHANGSSPKNQALMRLDLPDRASILDAHDLGLPDYWRNDEAITQQIGMDWLVGLSSLALLVPSYIVPFENNILISPAHPDYAKIKLTIEENPFVFDPRLYD